VLRAVLVALVALLAVTRLFELRVSRRHRAALVGRGARISEDPGFFVMVCVHVGVLGGALVEPLVTTRAVPSWLGGAAALGVLGASSLRVAAIRSLGQHWNARIVDSAALGVVANGPYRFVRHPNYVAVFVELACLPLVQGAWLTAALGSVLHGFVLRRRILLEERVLLSHADYRATMGHKPRFFPRVTRPPRALVPADEP
jgi:methyltransferase